jgi:hypothetical protein
MRIDANPPSPWQPFTPAGVAALALARRGQLFRVQFVVALLLVGSFLWFLTSAWIPVIEGAASELPPEAQIRARTLEWPHPTPARLAGNQFLSITVDPDRVASPRSTTDVEIELGRYELRVRSLLGYLAWRYPANYSVELSRTEVQAWWGARQQLVLVAMGALASLVLFLGWTVLSLFYAPVAQLVGFYTDRAGAFRVYRRLAAAALMPGSVVLAGALLLYGLNRIDLIRLLFGVALHFLIGWLYLILSPLALPRRGSRTRTRRANPFRR